MISGRDVVTSEGRERIAMIHLERQTSVLVLSTLKTSAVGQRSDESGVVAQYRRHGSAKQTTWAYHGHTRSQQSAVKIYSISNWERISLQRERIKSVLRTIDELPDVLDFKKNRRCHCALVKLIKVRGQKSAAGWFSRGDTDFQYAFTTILYRTVQKFVILM